MPKLLILSKQADRYRKLVEEAGLPELELVATANAEGAISMGADCEIVFGEPTLIREALPALENLRWAQATWAGVEPLLDPSLRRDYTYDSVIVPVIVHGLEIGYRQTTFRSLSSEELDKE